MEIGERIRKAREAKRLSQRELAEALGVSQPTIRKIESGETKKSRYLHEAATFLSIDVNGSQLPPGQSIPGAALMGAKDFPIYSAAEGGEGQMIVSIEPFDWMPRPAPVAQVRRAYGLYIVGESMVPEFEPGDVAIVNPHLPIIGGKTYIFYAERHGEAKATIKRLRRALPEKWLLRQWNPPEGAKQEFELAREEWPICHRVIGKYAA